VDEFLLILPILYFSGVILNCLFSVLYIWVVALRIQGENPISLESFLIFIDAIVALPSNAELLFSSWTTFFVIFEVFIIEVVYPEDK